MNMWKSSAVKNSLLTRLLLVVAAFLVMIASSSTVMYYTLNQKLLRNAEATMDDTLTLFSKILHEPETVLELVAANIEGMYNRGAGFDAIMAYIDEASSEEFKNRTRTDYYGVYAYFDIIGEFHSGSGWIPDESYNPLERPWYLAAPETGAIGMTEAYIDMNTSRHIISYSRKMFDVSDIYIGTVAIDVFLDDFRDIVINKQITPNSYGYMIDKNYRIIMHRNLSREWQFFWQSNSSTQPYKDLIIAGEDISFKRSVNYQETRSILFGRQIYNGWYFVLVVPEREYYAELYSLILTTGILGTVLATALIIMLINLEKARRRADDERVNKSIQLVEMEKERDADRRIRLMLDSAPLCVIFWDYELKVVDCNLEGVKLFELADKRELMERWYDLSPEYQPDGRLSKDAIGEVVAETRRKKHTRFEWMHRKLNGEEIPCEVTLISATFMGTTGLLGYIRDLRELKAVLNDLHEAINEAEIANRSKSSFLAQMSHEIRTPMNSIMGVTEILLENELPYDISNGLGIIYNSCDLLMGIINDILDLSKIEAGKMDINPDTYHIASVINDSANLNVMRIGDKEIEFEIIVDENTPAKMMGDELRIKQILNNLLSNAFKYTNSGTVTLSVSHEPGDRNVTLVLKVRDTGCGMTKEQVGTLFDEYTRFNEGKNRSVEGTGLGLSITLRLVQLMGGEIRVESEPDVGSLFEIRIPQETADDEIIGRELSENLRNFKHNYLKGGKKKQVLREPMPYGHVLVVDDVDTNLYVAKGLMRPYKLQIDTAMNGFDAIDKVNNGHKYDIIFMDHMMPEMDGIETAARLRDMGYTEPIVALTANVVTGQADMFLENGFDSFIAKPIDLRQLNAVLNKYIRDKQPPDVIEKYRNQAKEASGVKNGGAGSDGIGDGGSAGNGGDRAGELLSARVEGLDITGGLDKFDGDAEVYLQLLRSYCAGVRSKTAALEAAGGGDIDKYKIAVHSIKGMSLDLLADEIGYTAAALEDAAKSGDLQYIENNNPAFMDKLLKFVSDIENHLLPVAGAGANESEKPLKDKPDAAVLDKLSEACGMFHMDGAVEVMKEIKRYRYSDDDGLVQWLQEQLDMMNFIGIAERLSEQ